MKVELEKLRLGLTAIEENVCIGVPDKDRISFKEQKNVTSDFVKVLIDWCGGHKRIITGGGKTWEVTVKEKQL